MVRPQSTSGSDPPRAVYGAIAGVAGDRFSHAGNVPTHVLGLELGALPRPLSSVYSSPPQPVGLGKPPNLNAGGWKKRGRGRPSAG